MTYGGAGARLWFGAQPPTPRWNARGGGGVNPSIICALGNDGVGSPCVAGHIFAGVTSHAILRGVMGSGPVSGPPSAHNGVKKCFNSSFMECGSP